MIVEDLDMIDEGNSHHVYSIGRSTNVELNFEHYLLEPKSENFDQLQKYDFVFLGSNFNLVSLLD